MHRIADNGSNVVCGASFAQARVETLNHAPLHIDAQEAPGRTDGAACFDRVVSGSWPEFYDCLSRGQLEASKRSPRRHEDRAQGIQEIVSAFGGKRTRLSPLSEIGANKPDQIVAREDAADDQRNAKDSAYGLTAVR